MKSAGIRILIVRPDAIGDVVLMIPLINTIKENLPGVEIYTLQQDYTKPLFDNYSSVDAVVLDWKKPGKIKTIRDFFKYVNHIKSFKFDVVIFSYFDFFYALLMFFARIPIRIGDANKLLLRALLTNPIKQDFRNLTKHETEQNIDLFKKAMHVFGLEHVTNDLRMDLYVDNDAKVEVLALLQAQTSQKRFIGIHSATGGGNRAWLPEKYAQLIDLIHENTSYKVVLTGAGEKEEQINNTIEKLAKEKPINFTNRTNISLLKALISCCDVFIGADTGPTHIAAALNIPVLSISPTKFVKTFRWGPWQTKNIVVGNPQVCPYVCYPYTCERLICLTSISPKYVYQQFEKLLKQKEVGSVAEMKRKWFKSSVNVGFYISKNILMEDERLKELENYVHSLQECKVNYYLICENIAIGNKMENIFGKEHIIVLSLCNFRKLIRFISVNDINLIHLMPSRLSWLWKYLIRQIVALSIYCPPIIIDYYCGAKSTDELLDIYVNAYN
jgi:heptosyltransferase III